VTATYVGRQYGVGGTSASVEGWFDGCAAELGGVVIAGARGTAAPDVVQVDLVSRTVDVLGAVDAAAVPRRILALATADKHAAAQAG